jgi:inorganic pyrophosphatase/exopolyphosphatase
MEQIVDNIIDGEPKNMSFESLYRSVYLASIHTRDRKKLFERVEEIVREKQKFFFNHEGEDFLLVNTNKGEEESLPELKKIWTQRMQYLDDVFMYLYKVAEVPKERRLSVQFKI